MQSSSSCHPLLEGGFRNGCGCGQKEAEGKRLPPNRSLSATCLALRDRTNAGQQPLRPRWSTYPLGRSLVGGKNTSPVWFHQAPLRRPWGAGVEHPFSVLPARLLFRRELLCWHGRHGPSQPGRWQMAQEESAFQSWTERTSLGTHLRLTIIDSPFSVPVLADFWHEI